MRHLPVAALLLVAAPAFAFSQLVGKSGHAPLPIGHEWLTAKAWEELVLENSKTGFVPSDKDPRAKGLAAGRAKKTDARVLLPTLVRNGKLDQPHPYFLTDNSYALAAIYGQRWVDIGGSSAGIGKAAGKLDIRPGSKRGTYVLDCFDAVAQNPDDVQHDHFNRQRLEKGPDGAIRGIRDAQTRFKRYFIAAAKAPSGPLQFIDGGVTVETLKYNRNYFLLGRPLHLLQDSFSSEHGIRLAKEGYSKVHGMTTYVCTEWSEQHNHNPPAFALAHSHGDIIWREPSGKRGLEAVAGVKDNALVAVEATKDLFAAFIRVMAIPAGAAREAAAAKEADALVTNWLSFRESDVKANSAKKSKEYVLNQKSCDESLGAPKGIEITAVSDQMRAKCLFNIIPVQKVGKVEMDEQLKIPYLWTWINPDQFNPVPDGWIPKGTTVAYSAALDKRIAAADAGLPDEGAKAVPASSKSKPKPKKK